MSHLPAASENIALGSTQISRRALLGSAGGLGLAALLAACSAGGAAPSKSAASTTLNLYSWADYFAPENLKGFQTRSGIKPNVSTFDSNDVLFSKLNSAARTNYDIVIPASGWIHVYAQKGLLAPLDHSKIPFGTLDPSLLNREYDPNNRYSVPKDWGVYGVIYDPDKTGEIKTWDDFFAAGLKSGVRGKIRLATAGYETVGMQLWREGIDWNKATPAQINAAGNTLKAWARKAKPVYTSFNPDQLVNGKIVLAVNAQGGARKVLQQNPKLKWVVPTPTSELWVDSYAIPKGAQHADAAYKFLQYQLSTAAQIADTQYVGYPAALKGLREKLPASTKLRDLIFGGSTADLSKLTTFVVNTSTLPVYQNVQNELQAIA